MDLGFVEAGHEIVWANDIWADAVNTYRENLGDHIHFGPIEMLSPVPDAEIVIGGFPCQGFSVANRGRYASDKRNELYLQLLRVINEKRPLYFVAENVKGLLSLEKGLVFARILADFEDLGYEVSYALLNAADFGVPQRRERVFIVGRLGGASLRCAFPPQPTHAPRGEALARRLQTWVGVGEALAQLPVPGAASGLANHGDFSEYKLRFNGYLGHRTVDPELPAPTITARGDDAGGVVVIHHPSNSRRISPREAATIQSFPVNFRFSGTRTSVYRQIANAVPPLLARRVAECIPVAVIANTREMERFAVSSSKDSLRSSAKNVGVEQLNLLD